jgi:orotate phosphoribosyltransferase-like protein
MSKMSDLSYDIEQLYIEGLNAGQIARELECPKELVLAWIADQSLKPFDEWPEDAQNRLIRNIVGDLPQEDFNPFDTINS